MQFEVDRVSEDSFYGNLLLGLPKLLEKLGIHESYMIRVAGATDSDISQWEVRNGVRLPEDMKNLYAATNGIYYHWNITDLEPINYQADTPCSSHNNVKGKIKVNSLNDLVQIYGYITTSEPEIKLYGKEYKLKLGIESKLYVLDDLNCGARVVLVYLHPNFLPTIWLCTPRMDFHFLADDLTTYLRMSIAYLGIPGWQYVVSPEGAPEWTTELFQFLIPDNIVVKEKYQRIHANKARDGDFVAIPLNVIDSNFFDHVTDYIRDSPKNDEAVSSVESPKRCEQKKQQSQRSPRKFKRKPLYYVKQNVQPNCTV